MIFDRETKEEILEKAGKQIEPIEEEFDYSPVASSFEYTPRSAGSSTRKAPAGAAGTLRSTYQANQ